MPEKTCPSKPERIIELEELIEFHQGEHMACKEQLQQARAENIGDYSWVGDVVLDGDWIMPSSVISTRLNRLETELGQSRQREALLIEKLNGVIQDIRYSIGPHDDNPTLEQALIIGWVKSFQAILSGGEDETE